MNELLTLTLALVAGVLLSAVFFGGLWWTVRKGLSSKRAALWFVGSSALRTTIVLAGFFVVAGGRWEAMLACLLGFIGGRFLVTWLTDTGRTAQPMGTEAGHAHESR